MQVAITLGKNLEIDREMRGELLERFLELLDEAEEEQELPNHPDRRQPLVPYRNESIISKE